MLKFLKNFFGAKPATKKTAAPYKIDPVKQAVQEIVCGDKKPAKKTTAKKTVAKTATKPKTTKKK